MIFPECGLLWYVWQVEALQASYKISAAVLNLDPRKLSTDALQPVWGLNQKLELLKIAFEVSWSWTPPKTLCSNATAMLWYVVLPCTAQDCTVRCFCRMSCHPQLHFLADVRAEAAWQLCFICYHLCLKVPHQQEAHCSSHGCTSR